MLRFLADENFDNNIVHGCLRRLPGLDLLRVQDVDLVDVFLEGRVTGRVVGDVIRGAQSFAGVQRNFRRLTGCLAACRALAAASLQSTG